jgi:hypothetical protein
MQLSGPVAGCSNDAPRDSGNAATVVNEKKIIITG